MSEMDTQVQTRVGVARILIKGGRVVDPAFGTDQQGDVLIEDGRISAVAPEISSEGLGEVQILEASGLLVTPGLIDMHVHLRELLTFEVTGDGTNGKHVREIRALAL